MLTSEEDDEKYWYQSNMRIRNMFDESNEQLMNASRELASLVQTTKELKDDGSEMSDVPESDAASLTSSGSYSRPSMLNTSAVKSVRQQPEERVTSDIKGYQFARTPEVSDVRDFRRNVVSYSAESDVSDYATRSLTTSLDSRKINFDYTPISVTSSYLPSCFYDPCEFDNIQIDFNKVTTDLMLSKPVALNSIKTGSQKELLLKHALRSGDGNAIIASLIYLRDTLSHNLFFDILLGHRSIRGNEAALARKHYIRYIKFSESVDFVTKELKEMGLMEEAMAYYLKQFNQSYNNDFAELIKRNSSSSEIVDFMGEKYKKLLSFLGSLGNVPYGKIVSLQLYFIDVKKRLFYDFSKMKNPEPSLYNEIAQINSPMELLRFCLIHNNRLGTVTLPDIKLLCDRFLLSNKQHAYSILTVMTQLQQWQELREALFNSVLGTRLVSGGKSTPWQTIADIVACANGPVTEVATYVKLITDPLTRIEKAKRYGCYDVVVDTLARDLKDREKLESYRQSIPKGDPAYMKATQYLSTMTTASTNDFQHSGKKDRFRFKDLFMR